MDINHIINALQSIFNSKTSSESMLKRKPDVAAYWGKPSITPTPTQTPATGQYSASQVGSVNPYVPVSDETGTNPLPANIAQPILNAFNPYNEATNAASVLRHPMQVSGTPAEIKRGVNWFGNRGENPSLNLKAENKNADGSVDRGLFQINSNTFSGMQNDPFWNAAMQKRGITSFDDMFDAQKNATMAMLILMRGNFNPDTGSMNSNPNYRQWYAAPKDLRNR